MQDEDKSKQQLITELHELRERVAELEKDNEEPKRMEELLEPQRMLQSVLDTIPTRVFWKDLDSNYLGCNLPFALDAGLQSPEEIIGRNDFEMGWAEQAGLYISDDRLVMETGISKLGYEEPQTTPSGDRIWLRTSKVPLFDMKGQIKGVLGTYEDITVNKRAEDALQLSERRLRRAEVVALFGNWEFILGRDKVKSSEGARIIYGLEGAEWSIPEVQRIPLPEYRGMLDKALSELVEEGKPYNVEFKICRPTDGKIIDIHSIAEYSPEKRVVFGVIQDITERKWAEEEIRQTNAYLENIFENSPDAISIVDSHGRFIRWNKMGADLYGYTFEDMKGKSAFDLYADTDELEKMLMSLRRKGSIKKWEMRMKRKDGSIVPFEISIGLLKDSQNETLGSVSVARDLSEIKETLTALRASNDQLNQEIIERKRAEQALNSASQKFTIFAYSVAHDLKSPAIGVYGLTKRLSKHARDVLDEKGRTYCDQIMKVSEHIASMVEKINIYIATKEAAPVIETINITEILRMLKDEFSGQLSLRRIDWFAPESGVKIEADRLSILRIFRNLIDNALKYGGESLTRISIGYEESESLHIFSVSDNGKGLKEADFEKIFGLFQRNETSRGVEGAGLGLAIVKEIAEQHGGRVWVESRGKKGITFYVSISRNL